MKQGNKNDKTKEKNENKTGKKNDRTTIKRKHARRNDAK